MITVEKLIKQYDGHVALDGLTFSVNDGDIFGFLGPNGAGKTTTIRILTGILKADSGKVVLDGHDVLEDMEAAKRIMNALPESNGYYGWMTAGEYLRFFARLYDEPVSDDHIYPLLSAVGLKGKERNLVRTFSRGMKQRLGLARAMVNKPKLLILDEPTNGLDPIGRRDIHDLLIELNRKNGTTIFLSTHLLDDVERLCNRIAILNYGKIVKVAGDKEMKGRIEDIFFLSTERGNL